MGKNMEKIMKNMEKNMVGLCLLKLLNQSIETAAKQVVTSLEADIQYEIIHVNTRKIIFHR